MLSLEGNASERTQLQFGSFYLPLLSLLLLGYALLGRTFAYLGTPPVYIGDWFVIFGVSWIVFNYGVIKRFKLLPLSRIYTVFVMWNAFITVSNISTYGFDTLRDAVIWGYSSFALILVSAVLSDKTAFTYVLARYRTFVLLFPISISILLLLRFAGIMHIPGIKPGDIGVHISGIISFYFIYEKRITLIRALPLIFTFLYVASTNRGGTLSILIPLFITAVVARRTKNLVKLSLYIVFVITLLFVFDIGIQLGRRDISPRQIIGNLSSVIKTDRSQGELYGTVAWRLMWWYDILNYTVYGDHFLFGKGYGVNLADSDGYQVSRAGEAKLRSPHNGHLTYLARAGVPGFVLWVGMQLSWCIIVIKSHTRAKRLAEHQWASFFLWCFAYWLAFMINASFDVYLEGPMGGIWFWTVFGLGIVGVSMFSNEIHDLSERHYKIGV